jgi:hypothetical protein
MGPERQVVLGISDRTITWADEVEYETRNRTKIFAFPFSPTNPTNIVALGSGDIDTHAAIAERTHQQALETGVSDVGEMARLYAAHFAYLRRERAETLHLAPLGLTLDTFLERQRTMLPSLVLDLEQRLQDVELGVEAIIAGVDAAGAPHIYSVGGFKAGRENAEPICHDHSGFCAVGSGANQFEMQLMFSGYDWAFPFREALLLTCLAKKQAEMSPGVGRVTDMFIIQDKTGFSPFVPEFVEAVEEYHGEFEKAVNAQRAVILERMRQDKRIFWEEDQAGSGPPDPKPPDSPPADAPEEKTGVSPTDPVSNG